MMRGQVFLTGEPQAKASPLNYLSNENLVEWLVEREYLVLFHLVSLGTSCGNDAARFRLYSADLQYCTIAVYVTLQVDGQKFVFALGFQRPVADWVWPIRGQTLSPWLRLGLSDLPHSSPVFCRSKRNR